MGVLPLLLGVLRGLLGQVGLPVPLPDELASGLLGDVRHARRVGSHVGYETHLALVTYLLALVEVLGDAHGARRPEAVSRRRGLLEGAGHEGRAGPALDGAMGELLHDPLLVPHMLDDALSLGLIGHAHLRGASEGRDGAKRERGLLWGQLRQNGPVLLGLEGLDLPLAVYDQPQRHGLHPARGETAHPELLADERRQPIAHETIQHTPRLLSVHAGHVDATR